jgi:hypothetical protein
MRLDTTDESLGMRLHEINRQKAIERALERLRHGLRADWHYLSQDDLLNLKWIIGELWSVSTRDEWEDYHFSKLGFDETRAIVSYGDRLRRHGTQRMSTLEAVRALVIGATARSAAGSTHVEGGAFAY